MKYLTAEEIRAEYASKPAVIEGIRMQMERIKAAAQEGETKTPLINTIYYYVDKSGNISFEYSINNKLEEHRQDVAGAILAHYKALGYKKTKVGQCVYLSWEEA